MTKRWAGSVSVAGLFALFALFAPVALAQGNDPSVGSGWVPVASVGGQLAGNTDQGFVVVGGNDFDNPVTNAAYSPDGVNWEPIVIDTPTGDPWEVTDVAVGYAGFVAVSSHSDDDPFVAFSADGRTWERLTVGMWAHHVVAGPAGFIALSRTPGSCADTTDVWFSADGRDWARSDAPIEGCDVVVATSSDTGWHLVAKAGSSVRAAGSLDGQTWTQLDIAQGPPAEPLRLGGALAVSGDTWVLSTTTSDPPSSAPGLWVSRDGGSSWSEPEVAVVGGGAQGQFQPWTFAVMDLGFVGAGLIEDLSDANQGFVLFSAEGTDWSVHVLEGCCTDIVENGGSLLGGSPGGVAAWNPAPSDLPTTGARSLLVMIVVALATIVIGGAAVVSSRHLPRARS